MTIGELIKELEYYANEYGDDVKVVVLQLYDDGEYIGYDTPEPYYHMGCKLLNL